MSRWIRLDCEYFDHDFFADEPFTEREAFQWLIINAAWKDTSHRVKYELLPVPRGSLYCTQRELSKVWKWSTTKVRNYLALLVSQNMIERSEKTQKTLVSICNYSKFQDTQTTEKTQQKHDSIATKTQQKHNKNTKGTNNTIIPISSSLHSEDITAIQKPDNSKIEISQAFEAYNLSAQKNGWAVSQLTSKTRISNMKGRLKECGGLEGWMIALEKCEASDFLSGRKSGSRGPFKLTIDFLLSQGKFAKVMEGNYDNPKSASGTSEINPEDMSIAAMFGQMAKEENEQERSMN
jgi:hypothetical protein